MGNKLKPLEHYYKKSYTLAELDNNMLSDIFEVITIGT